MTQLALPQLKLSQVSSMADLASNKLSTTSPASSDGDQQSLSPKSAQISTPVSRFSRTPSSIGLQFRRKSVAQKRSTVRSPVKSGFDEAQQEGVMRSAPVVAEIRTNVVIQDEYTFVTEFTARLSKRFRVPRESVTLELQHSTCLLFNGSFEPAYLLTITALPSESRRRSNMENAMVMQDFLAKTMMVSPDRGIVSFKTIEADHLAVNGTTIRGESDRLAQDTRQLSSHNTQLLEEKLQQSRRFTLRSVAIG
ncbi:Tautomerase/MIF [Setomelanomma holmii]|uniref:L-dopachrome isomerase n=1 Tax=Setomelanomma holmii TaxID=210430 RepID=A0A9P4HD36_9PLEO|nr:Tautomerase/MIF [Setomelanomma holmii]